MEEQIQSKIIQRTMFDNLCDIGTLNRAFKAVRKNNGAPGIDKITIKTYEENLHTNLNQLSRELKSWTYKPNPVKRVDIPKLNGGTRMLGIPCVKDRIVQTAIKHIIEPQLDPKFSEHSYAFRPNRNQQKAIRNAQAIVKKGKPYVVDIDLSKFFDKIHHDKLIGRLRNFGIEREILRIIGNTLRSGIMNNGLTTASTKGSPQGSPLSPLLSNVVLDELDKELEKRGLEFCRYADDCNIYVRTYKAASRVMESVSKFINKKLKLEINKDKSKVALARYTKFLGMIITAAAIMISPISMKMAMAKVKELTPRRTHHTLEKQVEKVNSWYMGWSGYYRMTDKPQQLQTIESHIRRRFRAMLIARSKTPKSLVKQLTKNGIK
ncbi:MAG: group II intron reverse transcriptase/maturase [bacterium]